MPLFPFLPSISPSLFLPPSLSPSLPPSPSLPLPLQVVVEMKEVTVVSQNLALLSLKQTSE